MASVAALLAACASPSPSPSPSLFDVPGTSEGPPPTVEERIAFHEAAVTRDPDLYPAHAHLAEAWLDRARESHDADDLRRAERALARSLALQPTFEAFKVGAALANFRHHFEEALTFAARAADALPSDTSITAMQVEALAALGRLDEAEGLLAARGAADDFYLALSRGRVAAHQGDVDAAVTFHLRAAEHARAGHVPALQQWALVRAAGVLIDDGRAAEAEPHLAAAARIDPTDRALRVHRAEVLEANGDHRGALALYSALLDERGDPLLHARAAACARAIEDGAAARRWFEAARATLERAVAAGEVWPLFALAELYADAGVELPRALELARRNLEVERDARARELVARLERALRRVPSRRDRREARRLRYRPVRW